jgi:hypothetical protein
LYLFLAPPTTVIRSSQPPSTTLENNHNFKNKFLSKFTNSSSNSSSSSSRHQKSLSEPYVMPSSTISSTLNTTTNNVVEIDPWLMSVKSAIENSINSDWLQKYEPSTTSAIVKTFGFGRSWKKRLFILVNRIVFIFKSSKPTNPAREHFMLTQDTFVFVTEEFKKGGFIIELRKPLVKWFIRCENVTQMKSWLQSMKKIVACIKIGYDGLLTDLILSSITLTDDYRILIPSGSNGSAASNNNDNSNKRIYRSSLPATTYSTTAINTTPPSNNVDIIRKHSLNSNTPTRPPSRQHQKRQSLAEIPDWETTLPPQMPPPRSKPPPVPPLLPTVSE